MSDRTTNGLKACISSLDNIVSPSAAASGDALAREQVTLLSKYLKFLVQRVDLTRDRTRFELALYCRQGRRVGEALAEADTPDGQLSALVAEGERLLASAPARTQELESSIARLRMTISRIVRRLGGTDTELRHTVDDAVRETTRGMIDLQRSWFAPQAWEADPESIPALEGLLAAIPSS
ncbi:hypothetical protein [Streptomyces sp. NPDC058424]|uniref:hypothetical protein n=1 Tax=Streptomyces sp. NPDC058424 TaxID=3346491 RepID=UPI00364853C4